MSQNEAEGSTTSSTIDHGSAFARIREQLADLDRAIGELRGEADRLRSNASSGGTALAVAVRPIQVEAVPPADEPPPFGAFAAAYEPEPLIADSQLPALDEGKPALSFDSSAEAVVLGSSVEEAPTVADSDTVPDMLAMVDTEAPVLPPGITTGETGTTETTLARSAPSDDGLAAIGVAGSTSMPEDWNNPGTDDSAFDRFFSDTVEPEPAQRWLLED